jgi:predicted NBD/HSP70 family sugar kinase
MFKTKSQEAAGASLSRRMNEQQVLEAIFLHGPLSRVTVASLTGLSKPTVSSIVDGLVDAGLVHQDGRTSGGIGRTAALYRVDGRVGHVIALDLGGTKVSGAIADLYGKVLAERTEPTVKESTDALLAQIGDLARSLAQDAGVEWAAVSALAIGVPGTVDPITGRIALAYNIPDLSEISLADELSKLGNGLQVVIENDVNAAAIGERWQGWAKDSDHFAFVAIGTGIGAGLVVHGELCRGLGGAAGEIGYLPFGQDPFDPAVRRRGALEEAVAGRGITADVERRLAEGADSELSVGCTAAEVFAAAARGDSVALESIDREARIIAMTIAALAAVVAPEVVVLGGGIGANELLLDPVRRYSQELMAQPLRIEQSALGPRAALVGALALGLQSARAVVLSPPAAKSAQPAQGGE